jgi:hypothetical protein
MHLSFIMALKFVPGHFRRCAFLPNPKARRANFPTAISVWPHRRHRPAVFTTIITWRRSTVIAGTQAGLQMER